IFAGGSMTKFVSHLAAAALLSVAISVGQAAEQPVKLTLHPGLAVTFAIYGGSAQDGTPIGDYDWIYKVTSVADGGYRYAYTFMGAQAAYQNFNGSQTVLPADRKSGTMLAEYSGRGDTTKPGYVSFLALSDATYAALKAGKEAPLQYDGPESPKSLKPI